MGNIFLNVNVGKVFEDLKSDLNRGQILKAAAEFLGYLNEMQNLPLNIAVVGKAGAGKSSFINAFRGVNDGDYGAAGVGRVEETKVPRAYPHPSFPNITLWEFPEIRARNSKAAEYFEKVQFERYDVFIMIVTDRFTENDAFLAKEIQRMRKKFYCVRSKMDLSIESERRKRNFNMEKTLETIRNYCEDNLKESAGLPTRVFLVSNLHAHMYDFPLLRETMDAEFQFYFGGVHTVMDKLKCFCKMFGLDLTTEMEKYILIASILLPFLGKSALWVMSLPVKYLGMGFGGVSLFVLMYYLRNKFSEGARKV